MIRSALLLLAVLPLVPQGGGGSTPPPNPEIAYLDKGIRVMNADGTNKQLVIANVGSGSYLSDPSWSADGQQLVFTGFFSAIQGIWRINIDGSNRQLVTPSNGGFSGSRPQWSPSAAPDGQFKILFTEYVGGNNDVFLVNIDGSGRQNLTNSPAVDEAAVAWAGDGAHLVTARPITPGAMQRELVRLDLGMTGGSIGIIGESLLTTTGASSFLAQPSWANAHDSVAYAEYSSTIGMRVMVLDSTLLPLTPYPLLSPNPAGDERWPTFSPDDSRLAYCGSDGIWVVNANGTSKIKISKTGIQPSWK